MTETGLRRRYYLLIALRWASTGLAFPVLMLLYISRGLDLPTAGAMTAIYSLVVVGLELPTGGFADLFGRRATMLAAHAFAGVGLLVNGMGSTTWQFACAAVLTGVGRALSSGPVDSWYVDTLRAMAPDALLRKGIAGASAVDGLSLGIGAVIGGAAPHWFGGMLSVPMFAAAGLTAVSLVAHAVLMTEPARASQVRLGAVLRSVPSQVVSGTRLAVRDKRIRFLVLRTMAIGPAIYLLEILFPLQLRALLGDPTRAATAYGLLASAGFLAGALGSVGAPKVCRLAEKVGLVPPLGVAAAAGWLSAGVVGLITLASVGVGGVVLAAAGFLGAYALIGVSGPLADEALHELVGERDRTTLLSVGSLALQLGGLAASLGVTRVVAQTGYGVGWVAAMVAFALAAVCSVAARRSASQQVVLSG